MHEQFLGYIIALLKITYIEGYLYALNNGLRKCFKHKKIIKGLLKHGESITR